MRVKICGLSTLETVEAAVAAGAGYVGFVFFPKSPRNVSIDLAAELARAVPEGVIKVALVVNPSDVELSEILAAVSIDMIQLHGAETPARVAEVKERFGLPVMKAVGVAVADDLMAVGEYAVVADQILLDAKAPKGADLPGGNGVSFDWSLLAGREWSVPWMLAGGLTPENVAEAARLTGAEQVDLSSGVEDAPGIKSIPMIKAMLSAAKG